MTYVGQTDQQGLSRSWRGSYLSTLFVVEVPPIDPRVSAGRVPGPHVERERETPHVPGEHQARTNHAGALAIRVSQVTCAVSESDACSCLTHVATRFIRHADARVSDGDETRFELEATRAQR